MKNALIKRAGETRWEDIENAAAKKNELDKRAVAMSRATRRKQNELKKRAVAISRAAQQHNTR